MRAYGLIATISKALTHTQTHTINQNMRRTHLLAQCIKLLGSILRSNILGKDMSLVALFTQHITALGQALSIAGIKYYLSPLPSIGQGHLPAQTLRGASYQGALAR